MGRGKSEFELGITEALTRNPMTAKQLGELLGMAPATRHIVVARMHARRLIRIADWDVPPMGKPSAVWANGDPRLVPDVPMPPRKPRKPWKAPKLSDEDTPSDFPRTVRDPARGVTRHYSGVQA